MILWAKLCGSSGGFACVLSFSYSKQVSAVAEMSQDVCCLGGYAWKAGAQLDN